MKIELKPNSNSQNMYNKKKNARVKISKNIKELDNYWYTTLCETCLILLNFYIIDDFEISDVFRLSLI